MRGTLYCLYGVYTSKRKHATIPKLQLSVHWLLLDAQGLHVLYLLFSVASQLAGILSVTNLKPDNF